jgi:hypothetical protein
MRASLLSMISRVEEACFLARKQLVGGYHRSIPNYRLGKACYRRTDQLQTCRECLSSNILEPCEQTSEIEV